MILRKYEGVWLHIDSLWGSGQDLPVLMPGPGPLWGFPGGSEGKETLPAMQETGVWSLD